MDSTLCGKCEPDELAVIPWLLTRVRPDFKLSDLRCGDFEAVVEKIKFAANRLKEQNPASYNLLLTKIRALLAADEIMSVSYTHLTLPTKRIV